MKLFHYLNEDIFFIIQQLISVNFSNKMATDSLYFIMYFFTVRAYKYKFNTSPEVDSVLVRKSFELLKTRDGVLKTRDRLLNPRGSLLKTRVS